MIGSCVIQNNLCFLKILIKTNKFYSNSVKVNK